MANNFFRFSLEKQIQTLINQKAMGAHTKKEENKLAVKKGENKQEASKAEPKTQIEKVCKNCNEPFFIENPKKETCSDKCRPAYSQKNK